MCVAAVFQEKGDTLRMSSGWVPAGVEARTQAGLGAHDVVDVVRVEGEVLQLVVLSACRPSAFLAKTVVIAAARLEADPHTVVTSPC